MRTALLKLDSVYGLSAERDLQDPSKMRLGKVTLIGDQDISLAVRRARMTITTSRGRGLAPTSCMIMPP